MNDNEKLIIYILSGLTFATGCLVIILGFIFCPRFPQEGNQNENNNNPQNNVIHRDITRVENDENYNEIIENLRNIITPEDLSINNNIEEEEEVMVTFKPSYFEEFRHLEEQSETDF